MSIDKYEQQFLTKTYKEKDNLLITLNSLSNILGNKITIGKVIEIRAKELSGLSIALDLSKNTQYATLLIDSDKSFDKGWYKEFPNLLLTSYIGYENLLTLIEHTNEIKVIIFNTILSLLPINSNNNDLFEQFVEKLVNHCKKTNKTIIFLNPYLDNKYDIISQYSDLIIVNRKHTSIKKNEERLGYNLTGEIIKNTINFKLGKFDFGFLYSEGVK